MEQDAVSILHKRQEEANKAWMYLQSKDVLNLDIERPGKDKVTLVELLSGYARQLKGEK